MYDWTRPYIAIPVHGEAKHLVAHAKLAQASQVPITKILENGTIKKFLIYSMKHEVVLIDRKEKISI